MTPCNMMMQKIYAMETAQIMEVLDAMVLRADDEADVVLECVLVALELRMPAADFIVLCDKLAA